MGRVWHDDLERNEFVFADENMVTETTTTETSELVGEIGFTRDWLDIVLKLAIVALLAILSILAAAQLRKDTNVDVHLIPTFPAPEAPAPMTT